MTGQNQDIEGRRLKQFWITWRGWVLLALFLLAVVTVLVVLGVTGIIDTGFGEYKPDSNVKPAPERAKTLWDWMDLLLIPLVLALGAALFTWVTNKRSRDAEEKQIEQQREIELDRSREAALQAYLDRMGELLLEKGLRISEQAAEVRRFARTLTLTTLRQLDGVRKGVLVQFLYEAGLIERDKVVVDLDRADLTNVSLYEADMTRAEFFRANMAGADLREGMFEQVSFFAADLRGAHFGHAYLHYCFMRDVNLSYTDLRGVGLGSCFLRGADLYCADLTNARIDAEQLAQVDCLEGATLPDGTIYTRGAMPGLTPTEAEPQNAEGQPEQPGEAGHA